MDTARPSHTWVPYVAGLAGGAYLLKTTLAIAGDNGVDAGPVFGVLYLSGLTLGLAAAIGTGLRQESIVSRIAVAGGLSLLLVAWIIGLGDAIKPVVGVFSDAQHVKNEVPIGVAGVALLILAYLGYSHDQDRFRPRVSEPDRAAASHTL